MRLPSLVAVVLLTFPLLGGCNAVPKDALALQPQSMERRQLQTRRFDTGDEVKILRASTGLLQDLGFSLESTQSKLGLLTASKDRDATEGGQVAGAILVAALFGVSTPIDTHQKIRICVVTAPKERECGVRVTFQRVVWNNYNQISKLEFLDDQKLYDEFFEKLSKSVFLEAHKI